MKTRPELSASTVLGLAVVEAAPIIKAARCAHEWSGGWESSVVQKVRTGLALPSDDTAAQVVRHYDLLNQLHPDMTIHPHA